MDATGAPIRLGVLYDFPQQDGGTGFEGALRLGIDEMGGSGRIDRPVELVTRHAQGLPLGTAHAVETAFAELVAEGVLAIAGPSISDNGLIVRDLADEAGVACINYTGGELTRGRYMFHYQVGSLEEEPAILAVHLRSRGLTTVAMVHDHSPVGRGYASWFDLAASTIGIEVVGRASVTPLADDVTEPVARLQAASPAALVYFGLGVTARSVALAVESLKWE